MFRLEPNVAFHEDLDGDMFNVLAICLNVLLATLDTLPA